MDRKTWIWVVFALMFLTMTAQAVTTEKYLLNDTFDATSTYTLEDRWGKVWYSNDKPNFTHFSIEGDPTNYPNGVLRMQYGYAESNGASTITFYNGTASGVYHYNMEDYLKQSIDIYLPDSYSDNFGVTYMLSSVSYLKIIKYPSWENMTIYYQNTAGSIVSIETNVAPPVGKWFRITAETFWNRTEAKITITDLSTKSQIYSKDITEIKLKDARFSISITRTDANDGHYIYFDNAVISTKENVPESPIPENPLKDAIEGSYILLAVFIALVVALTFSFVYDHWSTVILIFLFTAVLFSVFLIPYFGITDKTTNILISGGTATVLSGAKYYSIRDKLKGIFQSGDTTTIIILVGIVVLLALLFLS